MGKKVVFCVPTLRKPHRATLASLAASMPLITAAGWDDGLVSEIGCPYVSAARATMLRKALDARADVIVFIDHDVSWKPENLLTLIEAEGDVVVGTYRFKRPGDHYMGQPLPGPDGRPQVREDGAIKAFCAPAGFLKVTKGAINTFIGAYPELCYGDKFAPHVDLFNHGAHDGVWYGEDYAFCRRWLALGGDIWLLPELQIDHHSDDTRYVGHYAGYLRRQPGGSAHVPSD